MKTRYIKMFFAVFLSIAVLAACGPSKEEIRKQELQQEETLAKEVLDIHDEVMPKMGELSKLRKQLKEKINIWTEDLTVDRAENTEKATALVQELDAADKGMMDWMHEYNGGQGLYDHAEIIKYLESEKVKVEEVKKNMNTSIENAKQFLESIK